MAKNPETLPSASEYADAVPSDPPTARAQRPGAQIGPSDRVRPHVRGKFLFVEHEKLYVRGVTYGTFSPDPDGERVPAPDVVARDFASMSRSGFNTVRTYTPPPRWLLDLARHESLFVLAGLPWEQHLAFLEGRGAARSIRRRVAAAAAACAGHPALLGYTVGNEIPGSIVRWYGPRRVERLLDELYREVKQADPEALVTYANYPTTEYLDLGFLDAACFNVFVETSEFAAYVARLQNLAGDRPLLLTEIGLDSRRNGLGRQAGVVAAQVRAAFAGGAAGAVIFAWTDDWHRADAPVDDWDFGLVDRGRRPKPALAAARHAFAAPLSEPPTGWPSVSVVVCAHNAAATLDDCLDGIRALRYPDFDVIVVDDGSWDGTSAIAVEHGFAPVATPHRGLSAARNAGLEAASGEIVAYIDADARPDPDWLSHLALAFRSTSHDGVGGPNIAPPEDAGGVSECVDNAPGGPVHVLLSDAEAEHIPGCNMAFRRAALQEVGGFDPQFRIAGDDVDICWRLRERGSTLGFSAGAVVLHRRRATVRGYLRQQREYGRAEALLERKWPEKYNRAGHLSWAGHVYGGVRAPSEHRRWRIYYGTWGSALFQSVYRRPAGTIAALPLMPEWYLVLVALGALSALGALWAPLLATVPLLVAGVGALLVQVARGAAAARIWRPGRGRRTSARLRAVTALLILLQPLARLSGRLTEGLAPWRRRGLHAVVAPRPRQHAEWSERWQPPERRLATLEARLRALGATPVRGGAFDRWDLHVPVGMLGAARVRLAAEEHGRGRQLYRVRTWPRPSRGGLAATALLAALAVAAGLDGAAAASLLLGALAAVIGAVTLRDTAAATGVTLAALRADRAPAETDVVTSLFAAVGGAAAASRRRPVSRHEVRRLDPDQDVGDAAHG